jgi:hypothetical protein
MYDIHRERERERDGRLEKDMVDDTRLQQTNRHNCD